MQTSYGINMAAKIAGMLSDLRPNVVESYTADVAMGFGLGVMAGAKGESSASHGSVKLPTAGGQTFRGITLQQHTEQTYPFSASSGGFAINDVVPVMRRGRVSMQASGTVTADNPVYIVASGADAGKAIDSSANSAIATGGYFRETTTVAGTIADVEINLP